MAREIGTVLYILISDITTNFTFRRLLNAYCGKKKSIQRNWIAFTVKTFENFPSVLDNPQRQLTLYKKLIAVIYLVLKQLDQSHFCKGPSQGHSLKRNKTNITSFVLASRN